MPYRGLLQVYSVHWRHSQQPPAHWTVRPLADQTFVGVSLASVHAPGLSSRHVTRSAHRASGYQQAAICYSWCGGGSDFSRAEPAAKTHYVPRQQSNDQDSNLCNTRSSQRDTQLVLHRAVVNQPSAWTGELPLTSRSGKREHRRPIITTDQPQ